MNNSNRPPAYNNVINGQNLHTYPNQQQYILSTPQQTVAVTAVYPDVIKRRFYFIILVPIVFFLIFLIIAVNMILFVTGIYS